MDTEPHLNAPFSHEDDARLLQELHDGNREAFTVLYNLYQPRLYLYLEPFTRGDKPLTHWRPIIN